MNQSNSMSEGLGKKSVVSSLVGRCRHLKSVLTLPVVLMLPIGCSSRGSSVNEQTDSVTQGVSSPTVSDAGQAAQTAAIGQPAPPTTPSREEWHKTISKNPAPKKGCFRALYPSTSWEEVYCTTGPQIPQLSAPSNPQDVGGGGPNDYSALVSGTISQVQGTFGVTVAGGGTLTENDNNVANVYTLQVNSNYFNTPACNNHLGCQGVQQFIFENAGNVARIYMQYWLSSYLTSTGGCASSCPTYKVAGNVWNKSLDCTSCWVNGYSLPVSPAQPITNLTNLRLVGIAQANNLDNIAIYCDSCGGYVEIGDDSVLGLAQGWNSAEFNVFGDSGSSKAVFTTPGVTITVTTSVTNGTTAAPTCLQFGNTGETNSLGLVASSCCATGGTNPAIQFMESNVTPMPPPFCLVNDITPIQFPLL